MGRRVKENSQECFLWRWRAENHFVVLIMKRERLDDGVTEKNHSVVGRVLHRGLTGLPDFLAHRVNW